MNEEERIKKIKTLRDAAIERRDPWYLSTGVYISDVTYLLAQLAESQRREKAAVSLLQTIDWVGSGAKARIEEAIGILAGIQEDEKGE